MNNSVYQRFTFRLMALAIVLCTLGIVTQIYVLATERSVPPRFTKTCPTCGYRQLPMQYPPAFYDCPECERLISLGVDLSD